MRKAQLSLGSAASNDSGFGSGGLEQQGRHSVRHLSVKRFGKVDKKNFAGGCTTSVQWVANPSSAAQISPALSPATWCVFGVLYLEGNLLSGTSLTSTAHRTHTYSSLFVWFVQKCFETQMRLIWWGGCGRARIFHHVNCLGVYDKYNVNCWGIYYKYKATNNLKPRAVKFLRPCKRAATTNSSKQGVWEFTLECNCLILYSNKVHTCLLAAHITIYLHSREAIWSVRAPCRPRRGGWRRWPGPAPATSPPWPPAGLAWAKTSDSSRPAQGSTSEASSVLILPPRRRWVPPAWETTPSLSASSLSSTSFVVSYFRWRDTSFSGVSEKPHRVETKKLWPVQILNSWKNWTVQKLNRGELKCSQRGELSCSKRKNWSVQSSILLQRSLSVQSLDSTPSICDILKYTQDTPLHVYLFLYLFVCLRSDHAEWMSKLVKNKEIP